MPDCDPPINAMLSISLGRSVSLIVLARAYLVTSDVAVSDTRSHSRYVDTLSLPRSFLKMHYTSHT